MNTVQLNVSSGNSLQWEGQGKYTLRSGQMFVVFYILNFAFLVLNFSLCHYNNLPCTHTHHGYAY